MNNLWGRRASMETLGGDDQLRKVLDPSDAKGIKNVYIDHYLKYHLLHSLRPSKEDALLEIGSGTGRLTEFLSAWVAHASGVDVVERFVADCNASPFKKENTSYYHSSRLGDLSGAQVTKIYCVWVLMYVREACDLIKMLGEYRLRFPMHDKMIVIEQVTSSARTENFEGDYYCAYRTIDEYADIFERAGFSVIRAQALRERSSGFFFHLLFNRYIYPLLPRNFSRMGRYLFALDRFVGRFGLHLGDRSGPGSRPQDVLFELRVKK